MRRIATFVLVALGVLVLVIALVGMFQGGGRAAGAIGTAVIVAFAIGWTMYQQRDK